MNSRPYYRFDWIDGLKAFAILGIILNHTVELYGNGPWFSNPSYNWPILEERLSSIIPDGPNLFIRIIRFLGWLGDMGPGIFILASGFTLAYSSILKNQHRINLVSFYKKRALRLFPLYVFIHIGYLILLRNFGDYASITSPNILLSLLGLRATNQLFFFLNPSWWFIWLIIQLYILYPFLFRLLQHNLKWFIFITLTFTMISRLAGLLDMAYTNNLYYWMTGLFFGSRLFEFTFGMASAKLLIENKLDLNQIKSSNFIIYGLIIYFAGLCCSLFYYSTIFSNIFVTIGLCSFFFGIFKVIENKCSFIIIKTLKWIGLGSFPVFLIHQPILSMIIDKFSAPLEYTIIALTLALLFPFGILVKKTIYTTISYLSNPKYFNLVCNFIKYGWILSLLMSFIYLTISHELIHQLFVVYICTSVVLLIIILLIDFKFPNVQYQFLNSVYIITAILTTFLLSLQWIKIYWLILGSIILLTFVLHLIKIKWFNAYLIGIISVVLIGLITESYLKKNKPLESGKWGEYPALQEDSLTIYSLIPNKNTNLRYNYYNYIVNTNSQGFNSPEIDLQDTSHKRIFIVGDAFTMPEGISYEYAYPYLLEQKLRTYYKDEMIEVINGGVTGYGPNEMFAQIKKYISILKPSLIINQYFINEFEEVNLSADQRIENIGFTTDSRMNKPLYHGQIPRRLETAFLGLLNPKKKYQYNEYKSFSDFYIKGNDICNNPSTINKMDSIFIKIKEECKKYSCSYIVLFVPGQLAVSKPKDISYFPNHLDINDTTIFDFDLPNRICNNICKKHNIPFLDPTEYLRNYPIQPLYYQNSWHWNNEGHKAISNYIGDYLINHIKI